MAAAVAAGLIEPEAVDFFAGNRLVLAAPSDNPAQVATLADLTGAGVLRIGIGKPETVPAGQYARSALMASGWYEALRPKFIVCEHVRQVLDYLARGEVDCGFVYRTDALKAGSSVAILQEVPLASPITYPIAVLKESPQTKMAQAFVAFVTGPEGRQLLVKRGFQ
jgi:molybdate transport system substrate-binding protein